ncbi:hypothetical protein A1O3_06830 [Capronia epimyces CBS 606.96]|uniref:BTB domain-containing protein n=1 Tax=Capronia epimyces CBS 606.96 TaxID=1182542 RepID=W9XS16_9EURO|nr:uncharacterized protein A1O3_06830 [Capronia epimyces CBS 606.96]EXJ83013.1 hypothetical protein A1O3_06830 [Capronia epimyces CBS 606.96]
MVLSERGWNASERKRRFEEDLMFVSDESTKNETPERQLFNPDRPPRLLPRKRRQTLVSVPSTSSTPTRSFASPSFASPSFASPSFASPSFGSPRRKVAPKVKTEEEVTAHACLQERPMAERVKIYVGPKNRVFTVGLQDLDKSTVLKSLMNQDTTEGAYIMHPELTKINADHFQSVFQYLLMDEYVPAITSNPDGPDRLPKQLDGLTTAEDYQTEALRAGRVYVIAKGLGMASLQDLILRKITEAQYQPYGIKCHLDLAMVVFSRPEKSELLKGKINMSPGEDALEDWLVESLKDRLQAMLIHHARLFFQVANHGACAKRGFGTRIFRRKVEDWEELGGEVVAIEDDE